MGKISPVSGKYIVHANIEIDGVVDRPDVIGAVFGQTEGLLGSDLELRELQRSGRIGRIEVNTNVKMGKTNGEIIIPSSMDKSETAIIAAALEVIERIGPCNAHIRVVNIEDIRISKRTHVVNRAKELLKNMVDSVMPDSQEIAEEVASSVRVMEITQWGSEKLPAGPSVADSEEIIVVEGRADVLNLLKNGFKNGIAMNGSNVPKSLLPLCKEKIVTVFVDGDRGGDLIVKEITALTEVDFVSKAPDGKEVEELTKKEIHKALRSRIATPQALSEIKSRGPYQKKSQNKRRDRPSRSENGGRGKPEKKERSQPLKLSDKQKKDLSEMLENLVGTHGAFVLDEKLNVLGKVPKTELQATVKSVGRGVFAIVVDGTVDKDMVDVAEKSGIGCVVGMDAKAKSGKVNILTSDSF
ncbi:MAG: DNA primase DnaG [Nanoarchaeota archaeon]